MRCLFCRRHGVRPYRPTDRYLRGDPARQEAARAELAGLKKVEHAECVLLSQDEARFPLVPQRRFLLACGNLKRIDQDYGAQRGLPSVDLRRLTAG